MASKRKQNVLYLEKKLDIIEKIKRGKLQRAAECFKVAKSTVSDIWKSMHTERIYKHVTVSANPRFAKRSCIVRDAYFQKLDEACYIWFQQQCPKGAPVFGPLVQEKALQLFSTLYPDEDKKSSSGWLHKSYVNVTCLYMHMCKGLTGNHAFYVFIRNVYTIKEILFSLLTVDPSA